MDKKEISINKVTAAADLKKLNTADVNSRIKPLDGDIAPGYIPKEPKEPIIDPKITTGGKTHLRDVIKDKNIGRR
ncbi:hypothetical protein B7982_11305 [Fibrobacter sp. UWB2]|uniref:hypothetical protein n=1 Tax=Fibrobacter sp. UWB2 TaxID=1964358 RepID=UPI000B520BC6|nr:hypothetical protein [Fibrobacter sp. UWB2]OWV21689.1 hypothetical protein B7982_11305 [Fibrobacter sp. UWB2]